MRPSRGIVLGWVVVAGCFPPPPVYRVQRSARVPRPTVPLRTGQPLSAPFEVSFGASSLGNTMKPQAGDEMKALEIPRYQLRGELRVRLFERGELAIIHERAIGQATKIDDTQADVDSGQPWSAGGAIRYAIAPRHSPWSIGVDAELLHWQIPYVEYRTCIENCGGIASREETHSRTGELGWGFGVTPSYRFGDVTLFGGLFYRNHPTIERKGEEVGTYDHEEVDHGPVNILVDAGVAMKLGAFTALAVVSQDLVDDPVRYGPTFGIALAAALDPGKLPHPPRAEPVEYVGPPGDAPEHREPPPPPPEYEEQY